MRIIDKTKLASDVCEYIGSKFEQLNCLLTEGSKEQYIDMFRKGFSFVRRGTIEIKSKTAHIWLRRKFIKKKEYDFDKLKTILKTMEKELNVEVVIEVVHILPDFDEDD